MKSPSRYLQWLVWGALVIIILGIGIAFIRKDVLGPKRPKLLVYNTLKDFQLTNQLGERINLGSLAGQVWVGDIIFTRCAGPCPEMTARMGKLQQVFSRDVPVRFVTLTTDPENDSSRVLRTYAERFQADHFRWWFLTGPKSEIIKLAVDGLKLTTIEKDPAERETEADLFIHSTIFVVVDKLGRLRATVESTEPDYQDRVKIAVQSLLAER